jgi:hypothetical protein
VADREATAAPAGRTGWHRYRVIVYALLGLAAVDVAVACLRGVWTQYDPNEYRARLESCRRGAWDLVLVGGSPMAEGIDPAQLAGVYWHGTSLNRTFNLGLAGGTTSTAWHSVEHGMVTPPRLLIYGIAPTDMNDTRDEPNGVWSLMDLADVLEWTRRRPAQAEWCWRHYLEEHLGRLWSLRYYRNAIRLCLADLAETWRPGTCPQTADEARYWLRFSALLRSPNGFAPRWEHHEQTLADLHARNLVETRFGFLENYQVGGHVQYLHRLLDWGAEHGTAVVLLEMPMAAELEGPYAAAFAAYRTALANVERTRGVPLLHATREALGLDDTYFADRAHLNGHGRARLGAWLRARLTELGTPVAGGQP